MPPTRAQKVAQEQQDKALMMKKLEHERLRGRGDYPEDAETHMGGLAVGEEVPHTIEQALDLVVNSLGQQDEYLAILRKRLGPILRNSDLSSPGVVSTRSPSDSPVHMSLMDIGDHIESNNARLRELLSEVQL